ncbi:MAG: type II secretion system F family protein [Planctomycetales bacterium]|nr:type II secretion system F family protein [Planctomycetales bacterium]
MDYTVIVMLAAFGGAASIAWVVFEMFVAAKSRAEERLDEMRDPSLRRSREEAEQAQAKSKKEALGRIVEKAQALAKPLKPKTELEQGKLKTKLANAGFRNESASNVFLGLKIAALMMGASMGGGAVLWTYGVNNQSLMKFFAVAGTCFYIPDLLLMLLISKRKEQIFLGLPDTLDLMVVCVEAGLGLDQALRKVSEEMKRSYPIIAEEFGLCNFQLQMGRTKTQVLQELGLRSGVDDLRALASILIQADKFGSSIATALRVQSDSMRTRRQQIAEEKAAKTAVKLIFPLVLFIFPGIFVVLVGPAAITMINEMLPAMGG